MKNGQILVLNEKEVCSVLDMPTAIADVETALKEYAEGLCVNPVKLHLSLRPEIEGYLNSMPAYLKAHDVMGVKLVSVYKYNMKEHHVPVTMGTIVLHRPETAMPFAVLDGTYVTAIRTGAAAGVGAKHLAKSGAHVALQIGAGAQGYMAARAILTAVPGLEELRVAEINPDTMARFVKDIQAEFPTVKITSYADYKEAIPGTQIVCAATTSPTPLLRGMTFDKGTTVLLVAEMVDNSDLLSYDRCILDFPACYCIRINEELASVAREKGTAYDPIQESTCAATLGEVIAGQKPGRLSDDDIIVAGFVGMGIEDVLVAKTAYDRAVEKNIGKVVDFISVEE